MSRRDGRSGRVALGPVVPLDYEFVAGRHFFTAAGGLGRGLCVAHGDLKTAFDEVGRQLRTILSENHGLELASDSGELAGFEEFRASLGRRTGRIPPVTFGVDWRAWALCPDRP